MGSHVLTGVVAVILGLVIGVVGLVALRTQLSPSAGTVANQEQQTPGASFYGSRS